MTPDTNPNVRLRERQAVGILLIVAGAGWLSLTMHLRLAASAAGPICGHSGLLVLHCPACYAAAAMIMAGFALGVSAARQSWLLREQKIRISR